MKRKILTLTIILIVAIAIIAVAGGYWYLSKNKPASAMSPSPSTSTSPTATPSNTVSTSPTTGSTSTTQPSSTTTSSQTPNPSTTVPPTQTPSNTNSPASTSPASTGSLNPTASPTTTPTQTLAPTPSPTATPNQPVTATFDFDTGTPALYAREPTPFNQTSNGVTAHFSSPSDFPPSGAFSVQNLASLATISTVINSTKFSGFFLWPSTVNRDHLVINFSRSITSISMYFKTAETHDPGPGGSGSPIRIMAYMNSATVGSPVTANGIETPVDVYPEGTLSFSSSAGFTSVQIDLPFIVNGASGFLIDNVTVITS